MSHRLLFPGVVPVAGMIFAAGCSSAVSTEAAPEPPPIEVASAEPPSPPAIWERVLPARTPIVLDAGTSLKVRTTTYITTNSHAAGDRFLATLEEPIVAGTRVIAPKGSTVRGIIASSSKGGRVNGRASLAVRLTEIDTPRGPVAIVTNTIGKRATAQRKMDARRTRTGDGEAGWALATRGKPAVLPGETLLTFRLRTRASLPAS